jgi:hypothetical protein
MIMTFGGGGPAPLNHPRYLAVRTARLLLYVASYGYRAARLLVAL